VRGASGEFSAEQVRAVARLALAPTGRRSFISRAVLRSSCGEYPVGHKQC
jgi:hypothetical protein